MPVKKTATESYKWANLCGKNKTFWLKPKDRGQNSQGAEGRLWGWLEWEEPSGWAVVAERLWFQIYNGRWNKTGSLGTIPGTKTYTSSQEQQWIHGQVRTSLGRLQAFTEHTSKGRAPWTRILSAWVYSNRRQRATVVFRLPTFLLFCS